MGDYDWIGPVASGIGKGINSYMSADQADAQMQEAYRQMLANLQARMGDYDALGRAGYQPITAQQTGPSALENIPQDAQARMAQQEAMAKLSELAANGGLSLADMQALNEIQGNLNRNTSARRAGLANEFAARGQLGSGAQLAMDLNNQSNAAMTANQAGESAAAQAQARALEAILQKGSMGRAMGNDEYQRQLNAARAKDLIEARNAAARTDASKYNNSIAGQAYEDELAKARGKTSLTNSMNSAVFGRGSQSANTTLGKASATNSLFDSFGNAKFGGGGGSSSTTPTSNEETSADLAEEEDVEGGGDD